MDKEEEWETKVRYRRNRETEYIQNNRNIEDNVSQERIKLRMDNMQKVINTLEDKFKRMEEMINRMMKSHEEKMERIIDLLTKTKKGTYGKQDKRKIVNYSI